MRKKAGRRSASATPRPRKAQCCTGLHVLHKSGPRPDLAHQFINFMLEGKNAAELTNLIGSGNPNRAALPYIDPKSPPTRRCFRMRKDSSSWKCFARWIGSSTGVVADLDRDQGAVTK